MRRAAAALLLCAAACGGSQPRGPMSDARRTYLGLLEKGTLPPDFEEEVLQYKYRGSSGKQEMSWAIS